MSLLYTDTIRVPFHSCRVSTIAQNGQTKQWLYKGNCVLLKFCDTEVTVIFAILN